ncbi:MAG: fumarylacetoacetate hydrolase family protein [Renibacterium sp.]|nr:fumarylacetoacetate hydrolase family protein [Renibacterium sp.]
MKFGTIRGTDGQPVVVVATGSETAAPLNGYSDVADLIGDPSWLASAEAAIGSGTRMPLAGVRWEPPLRRPGKILCVALNNSANPDRIISGPATPAMFVKPASSLIGHGQPIRLREDYGRVHPEPELAVVIGIGGTDIAVADAASHIFGYTIINDITSPTMRGEDTFHYRAIHPEPDHPNGVRYVESWVSYPARYKGADTFGPLGPWLVTADEIPDPHALRVQCRHDGRLITDDNTANLRFSVAEVISFASGYLTLEAGDIIAMGTALRQSGTAGAVQNIDLTRLGGKVEVEIEGIGVLGNPVQRR